MNIRKTISFSVGKGSLTHNRRDFIAQNVDSDRTQMNIEYCNENLEQVYHQMFDDALKRFNDKQKRADRKIESYYDKIRTGKQEKLFHEVIVQIGNREDTNSKSADSEIAVRILDEYMKHFQERNPNLRIFSAHLHLDEETPHLHIDFVPFTTESKRGLDTRVSLKQALANQGFIGKSRQETEWSLWVESEKEALEEVMKRHSVQWEKKGTHEKHLSVYDYEKKMRKQEVEELTQQTEELNVKVEELTAKYETLTKYEVKIDELTEDFYEQDEFKLPDPPPLMTAKTYKTRFVEPLFNKLIGLVKGLAKQCMELQSRVFGMKIGAGLDKRKVNELYKDNDYLREENQELVGDVLKFRLLRKVFGDEEVDKLVDKATELERESRRARNRSGWER